VSSHDETSNEDLWGFATSEDKGERAEAQLELAGRAREAEDWTLAKNLYASSVELFGELDREVDHSRATYSLGYCLYRLGEHEEAVSVLKASLAAGQQMMDSRVIAFSASPLGESLSALGKLDEAIAAYELALEAFDEIEDRFQAGVNALNAGELHGIESRQTRALELFIRAYNIFQRSGDAYGAAKAKERMAASLVELGDYDQAIAHMRDAIDVFTFLENDERVAYLNYRLGLVLNLAGKYLQAEGPLRLAASEFRIASDWSKAALSETQLAYSLLFRDLEDPNEHAEGMLRRAAAYFEAAGEQINVLVCDSITAERLMKLDLHSEAEVIWRDIIERASKFADDYEQRSAKLSLAVCLVVLGDLDEVEVLLDELELASWGESKVDIERMSHLQDLFAAAKAKGAGESGAGAEEIA
jgi:tetratricopeptide (TPR) repeat protein